MKVLALAHTCFCKALRFLQCVHRYTITPLIGPRCRFEPSCSEYCCQAVEKHGVVQGLWLGAKRVAKCSERHPGGFDPVPESPLRDGRLT